VTITDDAAIGESSTESSASPTGTRLELIAKLCPAADCPTVYRTEHGTVLVQGYAVTPTDVGLNPPEGEVVVEVPIELLRAAAHTLA
jgi:hypothetical protein